ncbi:MAG: RNA polymerase sigma factor [Phycisphaerales bacterium]|nr:RNA polymerase sigma factor [Phycisphaerales bacterium]
MSGMSAHTTTTALLESLRDPAQDAVWREFDARFRPLLTALAVRLGLEVGEAEDVAQETLAEFVRAYRAGRYDRTRGRLSSWIISIARNQIARRRRAVGRDAGRRGESALADLSDTAHLTAVWEEEERHLIILRAMELLRAGRTSEAKLRAFELVAVRGVPAEEAARQCGMTVDEVYTAKNRLITRMREIVDELTAAWREGE